MNKDYLWCLLYPVGISVCLGVSILLRWVGF